MGGSSSGLHPDVVLVLLEAPKASGAPIPVPLGGQGGRGVVNRGNVVFGRGVPLPPLGFFFFLVVPPAGSQHHGACEPLSIAHCMLVTPR